jgi:hypothetical protein
MAMYDVESTRLDAGRCALRAATERGKAVEVDGGVRRQLPLDGSRRLELYVELGASTHVDRGYGHARAGSAGLGAQDSW